MIAAALVAGAVLTRSPDTAAACRALAAATPETTTRWMTPDKAGTGFCRVQGVLRPVPGSRIGFELWLPGSPRWSGRFQMLGNGGYSSALPLGGMHRALARGSAVAATDTGHRGDGPDFARGRRAAIVDWGWRAVHATTVAAKSLITRFYGRAAAHAYLSGCSTGGHQAMMEAQRFPHDFDGIVAGAPGSDRVRLNAAFLWQFLANHHPGDDAMPILGPVDLRLMAGHAGASGWVRALIGTGGASRSTVTCAPRANASPPRSTRPTRTLPPSGEPAASCCNITDWPIRSSRRSTRSPIAER